MLERTRDCRARRGFILRPDVATVYDSVGHPAEAIVKELARFLLQNAQIDFSGDITIEQVRQFLRDDDSREARALLARLIEDKGVDDMIVTVADCLKESLAEGITEDTIKHQLAMYSES